jgi:hypothetical protein
VEGPSATEASSQRSGEDTEAAKGDHRRPIDSAPPFPFPAGPLLSAGNFFTLFMTSAYAVEMARKVLLKCGLSNWTVNVVDEFPEHPKRFGLCSQRNRTITLAAKHLVNDREAWETIYHEVAHALTPDDIEHGAEWFRTFRRIAFGI